MHLQRVSATLLVERVGVHGIWQRLRRLERLDVLTAVLVTAAVVLTAAKDYLPASLLIVGALVTQLDPKIIDQYKEWRSSYRGQNVTAA